MTYFNISLIPFLYLQFVILILHFIKSNEGITKTCSTHLQGYLEKKESPLFGGEV